jgi:hypothetical protein
MMHRLIVPLTLLALSIPAGAVLAQGAFPAPLPGQAAPPPAAAPPANDPAFPPVNGSAPTASIGTPAAASPFPSAGVAPVMGGAGGFGPPPGAPRPGAGGGPPEACMKAFVPLREDAEKKGKMIKAASERHAPPDEACKLIGNYAAAEIKMIAYVEKNSEKCGIPPQITDQLKAGHKGTEALKTKVCTVASQMKNASGPAGPTLSDVLGTSAAAPEATAAKKGGSTFDTLNGNVLTR